MLETILMALTVTVANPINEARTNVPVVIDLPQAKVVKSVVISDSSIPWQLDDLNGDGQADQLVILLPELGPNADAAYTVELLENEVKSQGEIEAGTAAMMRLNDKNKKHPRILSIAYPGDVDNKEMYNSIYGHGAILEGQYSAIRVYMDNRQSVDLYLKQTPKLELDSTCFYTTREQLEQQGYGRDVLWAGTSVALGSFRGVDAEGEPVIIDKVDSRGQRVVASGPLRSIIEVVDKGWVTPQGHRVNMVQRYTTYKGHRDYDVEVHLYPEMEIVHMTMEELKSYKPLEDMELYCTGIQKIAEDNEGFTEAVDGGQLSGSWGTNLPDKNMADLKETIGLGMFVPASSFEGAKEDELNYLTILKTSLDGPIRYSFVATGLLDTTTPAKNISDWPQWLRHWASLKANPVKVTIE